MQLPSVPKSHFQVNLNKIKTSMVKQRKFYSFTHLCINVIFLRWPNPNRHRPWFRKKGPNREKDGSYSDPDVGEKENCPRGLTRLSGNWRSGEGRSPAKSVFMTITRRQKPAQWNSDQIQIWKWQSSLSAPDAISQRSLRATCLSMWTMTNWKSSCINISPPSLTLEAAVPFNYPQKETASPAITSQVPL